MTIHLYWMALIQTSITQKQVVFIFCEIVLCSGMKQALELKKQPKYFCTHLNIKITI